MKRYVVPLAVCVACALVAAPAWAAVELTEFSVQPANPRAGGHPDVTIVQRMGYSDRNDDVRDSFVRLAPGLLGNPQNAAFCGPQDFAADTCPAGSQVGSVSAKVTAFALPAPLPGTNLTVPGAVYNLPPEAGEPARVGLVLRPTTAPLVGEKVFLEAPAVLRPGLDGIGLESLFAEQPRTTSALISALNTQITEVALTFRGQAGRGPFMRLPTSCAEAVSVGRASSYDSPAVSQSTSAFTPTDCGALPFSPRTSGVVGAPGMTRAGDSPPVSATLHFDPEEAALRRAEVVLPPTLQPNQPALARITCSRELANASACPESSRVGTAIIDSPLQAAPVRGPVYIAFNTPAAFPGLIVILPPPVGIRLDATVETGGFGTRNVFPSNPDLPVRSFTLQFDAGPDSPLVLTRDLCNPRTNIAIEATLVSHSGKRVQARQQPATPGCDPRAAVSIRRRGRRAKLVARLSAAREGPDMTAASLALPRPLRRGSRGPLVYIGKRRLVPRSGLRNASIALPGPARSAVVVWRGLRAGPKLRRLTRVAVKITDSRGQTTRLRPTVRVRGRRPPA